MSNAGTGDTIIRIGVRDLELRLDVDRSTLWRWYRAGRFPPPEYLAERRVWRLDVIEAWEREQLARPASVRRGARNLGASATASPLPPSISEPG